MQHRMHNHRSAEVSQPYTVRQRFILRASSRIDILIDGEVAGSGEFNEAARQALPKVNPASQLGIRVHWDLVSVDGEVLHSSYVEAALDLVKAGIKQ